MTKNNNDREKILSNINKTSFESFKKNPINYKLTPKSKIINIKDFCLSAKNSGFEVLIWDGLEGEKKLINYFNTNKLARLIYCDKLPIFNKLELQSNISIDKEKSDLEYKVVNYKNILGCEEFTSGKLDRGKYKNKNLGLGTNQQKKIKLGYDVTLCHATGGIAETGSVVVSSKIPSPLLFLTNCLILVVAKNNILNYYEEFITKKNLTSNRYFGLISGPSKTGDIEQTILTGAHGPVMSLVIIV